MRRWACLVLIVATMGAAHAGGGDDEDVFSMTPPKKTDGRPLIINGKQVLNTADWPATFQFGTKFAGQDAEICTSAAVGPRVILTAAHCLPDRAKGHVVIATQKTRMACDHHPDYTPCPDAKKAENPKNCPPNKTTSADYALCLTDSALAVEEFETLNTKDNSLKAGDKVLLTGFGCHSKAEAQAGTPLGFLFEGEAELTKLPDANNPEKWLTNYILTEKGAAICPGDSGGPSYTYLDKAKKSRMSIGVNSRSYQEKDKASFLSATHTKSFRDWANKWARANKVEICGLTPGAAKCHP